MPSFISQETIDRISSRINVVDEYVRENEHQGTNVEMISAATGVPDDDQIIDELWRLAVVALEGFAVGDSTVETFVKKYSKEASEIEVKAISAVLNDLSLYAELANHEPGAFHEDTTTTATTIEKTDEKTDDSILIECDIINRRSDAVEIQRSPDGPNPDHEVAPFVFPKHHACCKWIPRSCITKYDSAGVYVKRWFVTKENLWSWI